MLDEATVEQRLATLEQEVAELKLKSNQEFSSVNWLENLIGSISDEEVFLQALEYGRSFRQTDRLVDEIDEPA